MKRLSSIVRDNDIRYFQTPNGEIQFPLNLNEITYASHIDLENGLYSPREYNDEPSEFPTINELIASGKLIEKKYVEEVELYTNSFSKRTQYKKWQQFFKERGFNVTIDALKHNHNCWLMDSKSGYRDEENNYFLFTPCGCNPLSFTATRLDEHFDWQETYGEFFD